MAIWFFELAVLQNRRDLDLDPSRGNWFNIQVEPGFSHISDIGGAIQDPAILGNHTFIRNTLEYRTYLLASACSNRSRPRRAPPGFLIPCAIWLYHGHRAL